jgi:signal transduction histidine kinase
VSNPSQALWGLFLAGVITVGIVVVALGAALILAQRRRLAMQVDFARRLLAAQEDERARIAREVHDDALQRVALIRHELDDLAGAPAATGDTARHARAIAAELEDLGVMLRAVAHQLHPSLVEQVGLARALEALAGEIQRTAGIEVDLAVPAANVALRPEVALAAYRIGQEALRNAVKHAGTRRAVVELETTPTTVVLRVRDEGCGLPADERRERGLGLRAMRERAELVRGRLTVTSQPGRGTTVEAVLPCGDA